MSRTEEKRAAFSLAPWKRLWRCVCQHRLRLALAIGSNLLLAVADFYIPLLQSRVVDQFILTGTTAGFGGYAVKYIGVCLFEIAMLLVYFKACMGLEMLSGRDMKEACFVNLQKLSLDYYNVTSAGHTLSRVMSDTDRIATCIVWVFPDILWGFAYILGVLGVMLSLSPGLAMTIIVIAPIVTALTVYFQKKLIALNRDVRAQHSKITSSYNEGIMGAKTSKTLALEERLTDEFEQTTAQAAKAGILHGRMRAIYVPLIVLCGTLAASATLLRGGRMALSGRLSLGVLSAFMTYALSLFQTFRQQAARISQMISLQANVERVVGLIDEKPTVQDSPEVEAKYGDCFHPKRENWEEMRGEIDFDDVSFTYPDGGECGDKLSTGEKQLISFARAVIARPKIFVLDEATSSVDTETEMLIQKATHTLMQGTTSFVIAHRLSTIRQADVILVIDHGKIVEQGTHERLLKAGGAYAALYHTQLSRQE